MVYYSRYYIPEMLLTTLTAAVIVCGYRYARSTKAAWAIAAGACAGLMFITKETAGIAVACMLLALAATVRRRPSLTWPVAAAGAIAILIPVATLGFTNGWRALMSYWQRGIHSSMHRHAWDYYLELLVRREGLIVAAAIVGILIAATRKGAGLPRFLAFYACAITLVYSLIPYKTPWCVLGPLDAMILLAGAGVVGLLEWSPRMARVAVVFLLAVGAANLGFQAWRASFPWSSDPRNPYAYAHTGRDVYAVRDRLEGLGRALSVQVVSSRNLWPLPWYLRAFPHVGWWRSLGPGYRPADVILVTPEMEPALIHELYEVPPPGSRELYRSIFDRYMELRPQVELRGYVRASLYSVVKEAL
jgi:predicted membrane-bound mannosyltransferase